MGLYVIIFLLVFSDFFHSKHILLKYIKFFIFLNAMSHWNIRALCNIYKQTNCNDKYKLGYEEQFCSFSSYIHREKVPLTDVEPGKTPQEGNIAFSCSLPSSPHIFTLISNLVHCHFQMIVQVRLILSPYDPYQANIVASKMSFRGIV